MSETKVLSNEEPEVKTYQFSFPEHKIAVVDTAAIIKGMKLEKIASSFCTTQGVIDEIKDSRSRYILKTLPFELKIKEPSSESLAKGIPSLF